MGPCRKRFFASWCKEFESEAGDWLILSSVDSVVWFNPAATRHRGMKSTFRSLAEVLDRFPNRSAHKIMDAIERCLLTKKVVAITICYPAYPDRVRSKAIYQFVACPNCAKACPLVLVYVFGF